jgi:hypothetical protein
VLLIVGCPFLSHAHFKPQSSSDLNRQQVIVHFADWYFLQQFCFLTVAYLQRVTFDQQNSDN